MEAKKLTPGMVNITVVALILRIGHLATVDAFGR
jgi:hypothetical protein